jgi:hypothetical protein
MFEYALLALIALIVIILLWWLFGPSSTVDDLQKQVLRLEMDVLVLRNDVDEKLRQLENKRVRNSIIDSELDAKKIEIHCRNVVNDELKKKGLI